MNHDECGDPSGRYVIVRFPDNPYMLEPRANVTIFISFGSDNLNDATDHLINLPKNVSGLIYDRNPEKEGQNVVGIHYSSMDGTLRGTATNFVGGVVGGTAFGWFTAAAAEYFVGGTLAAAGTALGPAGTILGWTMGCAAGGGVYYFLQGNNGSGDQVTRLRAWARENVC